MLQHGGKDLNVLVDPIVVMVVIVAQRDIIDLGDDII